MCLLHGHRALAMHCIIYPSYQTPLIHQFITKLLSAWEFTWVHFAARLQPMPLSRLKLISFLFPIINFAFSETATKSVSSPSSILHNGTDPLPAIYPTKSRDTQKVTVKNNRNTGGMDQKVCFKRWRQGCLQSLKQTNLEIVSNCVFTTSRQDSSSAKGCWPSDNIYWRC